MSTPQQTAEVDLRGSTFMIKDEVVSNVAIDEEGIEVAVQVWDHSVSMDLLDFTSYKGDTITSSICKQFYLQVTTLKLAPLEIISQFLKVCQSKSSHIQTKLSRFEIVDDVKTYYVMDGEFPKSIGR